MKELRMIPAWVGRWAVVAGLASGLAALVFLMGGCAYKADSPIPASMRGPATESGDRASAAFPGGMPSPSEELWIIGRSREMELARGDAGQRQGGLMRKDASGEIPLPLRRTEVAGEVNGDVASVQVRQEFRNPYPQKIEAVYVFPLPENAAVHDFVMTIGSRRIRGVIRERAEAEEMYAEARAQGYVASLLTEERPNIFTQSVANLEPGHTIDITLEYFHTLTYVDGWFEFVFPMVVGPRFNPPGYKRAIEAAPRGTSAAQDGWTTRGEPKRSVEYLTPGETSGHRVSLRVQLEAPIEEYECPGHEVAVSQPRAGRWEFALDEAMPRRDFVLRYRLASDRLKTHLQASGRAADGLGYFSLMLVPPQRLERLGRMPLELVFVLDCSGSMHGRPLEQAKAAVAAALGQLKPSDTFQLIDFALEASQLGSAPIPATDANVRRGLAYLDSLRAGGGTMMLAGVRTALGFPHDPERLRFVVFLTDGYIGNEDEVLREVHRGLGESRIFSFGVGQAPNRYLLQAMARVGRGAVAYLRLDERAETVMSEFMERTAHPALTHVRVDATGVELREIYPRRIPDLFVGRPVVVTGRYVGTGRGTVRVRGRVGVEDFELLLPVDLEAKGPAAEALPVVWARRKIADLYDEQPWSRNPFLRQEVKQVALAHNLVSPFTAFVAVDASLVTTGTEGVTVPVAVPVPEGVSYDRTVR